MLKNNLPEPNFEYNFSFSITLFDGEENAPVKLNEELK
jgi:hypothetical protein